MRDTTMCECSPRWVRDFPHAELNVEGYPEATLLDVVLECRPTQCTLVPDAPDQVTSDHGWPLASSVAGLAPIIEKLGAAGIRSSLFVDPDEQDFPAARTINVDRIELYTEAYANAHGGTDEDSVLAMYRSAAQRAVAAGLGVNAGHDLNLENLATFLSIGNVLEVSIGHALTVESLLDGFEKTVRAYARICEAA